MENGKSRITRVLGKNFEVMKMILEAVHDCGGSDQSLDCIITDADLRFRIADLLVQGKLVDVDYRLTLSEQIAKHGASIKLHQWSLDQGDLADSKWPTAPRTGTVRLKRICFGEDLRSSEALKRFKRLGVRTATRHEFVEYCALFPKESEELVALDHQVESPDGNMAALEFCAGADNRYRIGLEWEGENSGYPAGTFFLVAILE